jgi:pimeloyl-ACP methyl ester carboxylesterase
MKVILILLFSLTLIACGGGDSGSSGSTPQTVSLQCDLSILYSPRSPAVVSRAVAAPIATAILVHGKTGSPLAGHMLAMQQNLNGLGYDIIMPYMTWSSLNWDGTLCDSISYLNTIIETEKKAGNKVILLGYSLGGPGVLAYASLTNTTKPDAVISVAPGHFIHRSSKLAAGHASSILKAKSMIQSGQSNQIATFTTINGGNPLNISCTPVTYLSMHDVNQYPNISTSTSGVSIPLLWLAGTEDSLTSVSNKFGLPEYIPKSASNLYSEITGTHLGIMSSTNTSMVVDKWYKRLK